MSELSVGQLKGLPVNSNVVTVPSGHTLYAPGHVVQVVQGVYTGSEVQNSSTTFADTGLTATITPKLENSKILVLINDSALKNNSNSGNSVSVRLLRGASVLKTVGSIYATASASENGGTYSFTYLDSPGTTDPVTYKTQFANAVASIVIVHGRGHQGTITLMEIAA